MGNFICCAVNAFLYLNDIHNIQIKTDKNNEIEHDDDYSERGEEP